MLFIFILDIFSCFFHLLMSLIILLFSLPSTKSDYFYFISCVCNQPYKVQIKKKDYDFMNYKNQHKMKLTTII